MDKKTIAIIILTIISIWFGYLAFKPAPAVVKDTYADVRLDSLKAENVRLKRSSKESERNAELAKKASDSLAKLPPKIKIKYVQIYKSIENSGVADDIHSFDTIFANAGLNRN